jgi:hypothetical protein
MSLVGYNEQSYRKKEKAMINITELLKLLCMSNNGNLPENIGEIISNGMMMNFRESLTPKKRGNFDLWYFAHQQQERMRNVTPNSPHQDITPNEQIADRTHDLVPLVENSFCLSTSTMIAARTKAGKTLLTIWLVRLGFAKGLIADACFFSLEDLNGWQMPRFLEGLMGYNFTIFSTSMWKDRLNIEIEKMKNDASIRAWYYQQNRELLQFLHIEEGLLRKEGISEKIPFKLMVFLKILQEQIDDGKRFFVLDSLSSIFDNVGTLQPQMLQHLLTLPSTHNATFIVLHHCTDEGKIYGSTTMMVRLFDTACIIEKKREDRETGEAILKINLAFERFPSKQDAIWVRRTKTSENVAHHEVIDAEEAVGLQSENTNNITSDITDFLGASESDEVSFSDLVVFLKSKRPSVSRESVKNALRGLNEDGLVEKTDGKWEQIRILR